MEKHKKAPPGGSRLEQKPQYTIKKYPRKNRLSVRQKVLAAIAVVLAIALVAVLAWKSLFVRPDIEKKPQTDNPQSSVEEIDYGQGSRPKAEGARKSKDYYTVLIMGRDTGGGGNTDTMLLASYDVTNQKASVMSIPRDTMVNVAWDVKKINSVYNMHGGGEKGLKALYKEVSQLVGFEPDFEVIVEWEAVGKLVDAIGGVWFDVPYQMDYHDIYQDLSIEQDKGYRLLSGDDAMQVIRWRKNDKNSPYGNPGVGDIGRMAIQQDFLKAIIKQMMTPSNVKNIGKIAQVFQESVQTDMSLQNILWFGQQAFTGGLKPEDVSFFTMPYKAAYAWSRSYKQDLSYVVPRGDELLKIVNDQLSPFAEEFTLSDLDIMFTNADGSVGSTTGYVEDAKAALPPVKPVTRPEIGGSGQTGEPTVEHPETGEPVTDPENGEVVVDPETGSITIPGVGEVIIDPESGEITLPGTGETTKPEQGENAGNGENGESGESGGEPTSPTVGEEPIPEEPPVPEEPTDTPTDEPDEPIEAQ